MSEFSEVVCSSHAGVSITSSISVGLCRKCTGYIFKSSCSRRHFYFFVWNSILDKKPTDCQQTWVLNLQPLNLQLQQNFNTHIMLLVPKSGVTVLERNKNVKCTAVLNTAACLWVWFFFSNIYLSCKTHSWWKLFHVKVH